MTKKKRMSSRIRDRIRNVSLIKMKEQNNKCYYCKCEMFLNTIDLISPNLENRRVTAEHLIPYSFYRDNSKSNIVAACYGCNQKYAARTVKYIQNMRRNLPLSYIDPR